MQNHQFLQSGQSLAGPLVQVALHIAFHELARKLLPVNLAVAVGVHSSHHLVDVSRGETEVQLSDRISELDRGQRTIAIGVHLCKNFLKAARARLQNAPQLLDHVVLPLLLRAALAHDSGAAHRLASGGHSNRSVEWQILEVPPEHLSVQFTPSAQLSPNLVGLVQRHPVSSKRPHRTLEGALVETVLSKAHEEIVSTLPVSKIVLHRVFQLNQKGLVPVKGLESKLPIILAQVALLVRIEL